MPPFSVKKAHETSRNYRNKAERSNRKRTTVERYERTVKESTK